MTAAHQLSVDARCLTGRRTGIATWLAGALSAADPHNLVLNVKAGSVDDIPGARIARAAKGFHLLTALRTRRSGARYLSPDSLIAPILLGSRATAVVHDLAPLARPETQTLRTRIAYRMLLRLAVRRVGHIIVPSEATGDELRRFAAKDPRIHVVAEAARTLPDPGAAPAYRPEGVTPPYILFTGTIEPRKNVPVLVETFERAALSGWQLVIAGGWGWVSPTVKAQLQAAAARSNVRLLGFVDDRALAALYRDADVFVYPSAYEGFGLPVLEAMAAGVPVITTDTPALLELAAGSACIVRLANLREELTHALATLCAHAAARDALRVKGFARAEAFDWQRSSRRILQIAAGG